MDGITTKEIREVNNYEEKPLFFIFLYYMRAKIITDGKVWAQKISYFHQKNSSIRIMGDNGLTN